VFFKKLIEDMIIEISQGEALDRVSILEIKKVNITDESRLFEINKELNQYDKIEAVKNKYIIYYKLLYYVNQKIWDITNEIKELVIYDDQYARLAFNIFELNQQRFRMKDNINRLENAHIKEQKSYSKKSILYLHDENTSFEELMSILFYLLLSYDNLHIIDSEYITEYKLPVLSLLPSLEITTNINSNNIQIIHTKEIKLVNSMKQDFTKMNLISEFYYTLLASYTMTK